MIGAEFLAEAIKIGTHFWSIACPRLGEHGDSGAIHVFEGFRDVGVAAVRIGSIEEA